MSLHMITIGLFYVLRQRKIYTSPVLRITISLCFVVRPFREMENLTFADVNGVDDGLCHISAGVHLVHVAASTQPAKIDNNG